MHNIKDLKRMVNQIMILDRRSRRSNWSFWMSLSEAYQRRKWKRSWLMKGIGIHFICRAGGFHVLLGKIFKRKYRSSEFSGTSEKVMEVLQNFRLPHYGDFPDKHTAAFPPDMEHRSHILPTTALAEMRDFCWDELWLCLSFPENDKLQLTLAVEEVCANCSLRRMRMQRPNVTWPRSKESAGKLFRITE